MAALRELVSQGIVRLVVDDGSIETDLVFHIQDNTLQRRTAHIRDDEGWEDVGGSFDWLGGLIGINLGANYHDVTVTTKDTTNLRKTSTEVDIEGHVKINVRGDYQPLRPPEPVTEGEPEVVTVESGE